jgi:formate dehydrogenase subunit gamma
MKDVRILAAMLLLGAAGIAHAAVPNEDAVPAYAEEQTILQLEQGRQQPGWTDRASGIEHVDRHTVIEPGRQGEYAVILQRGGNTWRVLRNGPLAVAAALLLLITLAAIVAFHLMVGPLRTPGGPDRPQPGEPTLVRFTRTQRWVHWATALSFVVLGLTGLLLLYGKKLVLPWLGNDAFAALALASKWLHNVAGPLFVLFSLVMFFTYLRHNHFQRGDGSWLLRLGGMFSHRHVEAPYFNAGEKLWFWIGVTGLGLLMAATGLVLDFPYRGEVGDVSAFTRYQLQWAQVLHLAGAALYLAASFGHIYLGTIGSPGAWHAMWRGTVSERWAQAHHALWLDRLRRTRSPS